MAATRLHQDTQLVLSWAHPEIGETPDKQPPEPTFVRHDRARRYVIRVTDNGIVRVTIPRWGSKREAQAFVERERGWVSKQWQKYVDGREGRDGPAGHDTPEGGAPEAREKVEQQLRDRAKRELPSRLMALAAVHGLVDRVRKVSIRNQEWRWGSCSPNGHICLNWRLVTMAEPVRDYVLIHELMHLKRMDHSSRFWKLVADACPGYREARALLRTHSRP